MYGDLGTSPLYLWPSVFYQPPETDDIVGALSLVLWTLTLIVVVKYLVSLFHLSHGRIVPPVQEYHVTEIPTLSACMRLPLNPMQLAVWPYQCTTDISNVHGQHANVVVCAQMIVLNANDHGEGGTFAVRAAVPPAPCELTLQVSVHRQHLMRRLMK